MARITVYANGEMLERTVQDGATIQNVMSDGVLGNTSSAAFRLNGTPATSSTPVRDGDRLQIVPIGGKLA